MNRILDRPVLTISVHYQQEEEQIWGLWIPDPCIILYCLGVSFLSGVKFIQYLLRQNVNEFTYPIIEPSINLLLHFYYKGNSKMPWAPLHKIAKPILSCQLDSKLFSCLCVFERLSLLKVSIIRWLFYYVFMKVIGSGQFQADGGTRVSNVKCSIANLLWIKVRAASTLLRGE